MLHKEKLDGLFQGEDIWGAGIKYTYNSFLGPVSATIDYSDRAQKLSFYAHIGYYFNVR